MNPVSIISMPHNGRCEFYAEGDGPSFDAEHVPGEPRMPIDPTTQWADLPIPMPHCLLLTTDGSTGRVIAAMADDKQIRWQDIDTVLEGVRQFNADIASHDLDGLC
jgi:hypothetical protein